MSRIMVTGEWRQFSSDYPLIQDQNLEENAGNATWSCRALDGIRFIFLNSWMKTSSH